MADLHARLEMLRFSALSPNYDLPEASTPYGSEVAVAMNPWE